MRWQKRPITLQLVPQKKMVMLTKTGYKVETKLFILDGAYSCVLLKSMQMHYGQQNNLMHPTKKRNDYDK